MLISRRAALEQGKTRYFTGEPCARGHVAERMATSRACVVCSYARRDVWRAANPEKVAAERRNWARENPERNRAIKVAWNRAHPEGQAARSRRWYLANKAQADAASADWRARNPDKVKDAVSRWTAANRERAEATAARWRAENPEKLCATQARRRAAVLKRTPAWANHDRINAIYAAARAWSERTGIEHHVDHIIPLQGKTVSGLHVETNLQIIPALANRSKSNRFHPASVN